MQIEMSLIGYKLAYSLAENVVMYFRLKIIVSLVLIGFYFYGWPCSLQFSMESLFFLFSK